VILFCFGLNWKILATGILASIPVFYLMVMRVPYRRARVMAFLDPWSDPENSGFQAIQSMLSMRSGGLWGVGLGQGQGKLFFLPEAHTDFTLAVFGEELGFIGMSILLILYAFILIRCLQVALSVHTKFLRITVIGLTSIFWLSVMINAGVVMGLLPTKGLTLPFLSYGGSSLVMMGLLFGVILNIEAHQQFPTLEED
jgi:cell division protein FtsW